MVKVYGKVACAGIAIGKIHVLKRNEVEIKEKSCLSSDQELQRLQVALAAESAALLALQEKVQEDVGEKEAAIFEVYRMLLADGGFREVMEQFICTEQATAEYAVSQAGEKFTAKFAALEDAYMRERAADIENITKRLLAALCGKRQALPELSEKVILVAEDFDPAEIAELSAGQLLALISSQGSLYSHVAILARTLGIPMLVQTNLDLEQLKSGTEAILDGYAGELVLAPLAEQKDAALEKMKEIQAQLAELKSMGGKETVTKGGRKVSLVANAGSLEEAEKALASDAEGIGLFRSEFLFLGRKTLPNEEEQFAVYKQLAQTFGDKKVIIRTMDLGADKQAECLDLEKEENPALGRRGIRVCLDRQDIFKTQLRALYRAAAFGNLAIMYPMIISTEEVSEIRQISLEVKAELAAQGLPYKDVEEGIMIETPAAVMISDKLAEMVDFFSIGTNDLTQYTLAVDRQNGKLTHLYNQRHEAVLRMIEMVVENAHKAGKWVGICGELAADEQMTKAFVEMGVDELSVTPAAILKLRKSILEME